MEFSRALFQAAAFVGDREKGSQIPRNLGRVVSFSNVLDEFVTGKAGTRKV